MLRFTLLASCSLAMATALVPGAAEACSEPVPEVYFTLAEPLPAAGSTGVPVDTAIVLRGTNWLSDGRNALSLFQVQNVVMTDPSGAKVALREAMSDWSADYGAKSWVPVEPLAPDTEYKVVAALAPQEFERPPTAEGSESVEFTFTTGDTRLPALALTGDLEVTLRTEEEAVVECDPLAGGCGGSCREVGTREQTVARVKLPAAQGGFDLDRYLGTVFLSDDTPVVDDGPGGSNLADGHDAFNVATIDFPPGERPEVDVRVPQGTVAYSPCFSLKVSDPRGDSVWGTPICLDPIPAPADGDSNGPAPADGDNNGPAPVDDDNNGPAPADDDVATASCSVGPPAGAAGGAFASLLAAAAALVCARRRRPSRRGA
ncbi:hypothetical protein [Sorangium sp. So ce131]|uniref:hypothetical protein n=1 Tax=Sorangium sp. So ce131 TaxID=3133282 RepID=UPI003F615A05